MAPAEPRTFLFARGEDGMVLGPLYHPITGTPDPCLPRQIPPSGCSYAPYSESQRLSTTSVLADTSTIKAKSTYSYKELMSDRTKHHRTYDGPQDRYISPLTSAQEYGWSEKCNSPKKPQFGSKQCKETKIAEHHILGPRKT
mmetsp:Transcript_24351/g.62474  ORF Transcript_24351/g.62474 Transcript_24351/m.62474 type:complete len:142 (+) Transcript_24351:373-798(+)